MELVKFEKRGFVGIITLNRPEALNALNSGMLDELRDIIGAVSQEELRCIIVTGSGGKAFAAGADIGEMAAFGPEEAAEFSRHGNSVFRSIELLPIPVIAAVNGFALGGGCELALSCCIRLASENAVFSQPESSLGVLTGFGGSQRLPRVIGVSRAKEMLYTGRRVNAAEALSIGLVTAVYHRDELMERAIELAEKISAQAPIAVRAAKKAINLGIELPVDEGIELEVDEFAACFSSEDQKMAMAAFLEKRKAPPFENK